MSDKRKRKRNAATQAKYDQIAAMLAAGKAPKEIRETLNLSSAALWNAFKALNFNPPKQGTDRSRAAVDARRKRIRVMAEQGYSSIQIASELHIHTSTVALIAKQHGIPIRADAFIRGVRHHDPARIIQQIVMDAEHLTSDVGLIDFAALKNPTQFATWLESLKASHRQLASFMARVRKESMKYEHEIKVHTNILKDSPSSHQSDADTASVADATPIEEGVCRMDRCQFRFE